MRIVSVGQAVFAATMIGLGVLSLVQGDFAPIFHENLPKAFTAREALVYLCAFVSLACGIGLLWRPAAAGAARVLLAYLLLWLLFLKMPNVVRHPLVEGSYQNWGETAVLVAGAWVLYAWLAAPWDRQQLGFATGDSGVRIARVFYGLAMLGFGLSHFAYLNLTAPLVPPWLSAPVGWSYFTGGAYLAAGIAILVGAYARLAALLSALQMGLFTFLVWVPLLASGHGTAGQWSEFIYSWTLTAAAWVVVDSFRGAPWVAVRMGKARRAGTPFA